MSSRLPALGPRGEGWVAAQFVLFGAIAVAGVAAWQPSGNPWGTPASVGGAAAIVLGGLLAGLAAWNLRASFSPFPRPIPGASLIESGAFRLIRHPIYSGLVLAAIGWGVLTASVATLALAGLLFVLLAGKSRREEAWLAAAHPGYAAYQARTKRLIPWIY